MIFDIFTVSRKLYDSFIRKKVVFITEIFSSLPKRNFYSRWRCITKAFHLNLSYSRFQMHFVVLFQAGKSRNGGGGHPWVLNVKEFCISHHLQMYLNLHKSQKYTHDDFSIVETFITFFRNFSTVLKNNSQNSHFNKISIFSKFPF